MCGTMLRDGMRGCNKPGCKLDHTPPQGWKKPKKKMMIAHVKATPDCTWNLVVIDRKWPG